jgi:hypothetical protein
MQGERYIRTYVDHFSTRKGSEIVDIVVDGPNPFFERTISTSRSLIAGVLTLLEG